MLKITSYVCTLKYVGQPLKKKTNKKTIWRDIKKKKKTNDHMSDLSPNISSVNVT